MRFIDRFRELERTAGLSATDAQDATALQALAALSGPFLPWTSFSMRPAAILAVVTDVALNDRRSIVECGSGNSTVFLARLLAQRGGAGHVHSIDHDARWAEATREALRREGLEHLADVSHAPLVDGWYDRGALPAVEAVDLLVVDGPPGWDVAAGAPIPGAREPALDVFRERLAPGATVVLDDIDREGERRIVAAWEGRHGLRFRLERGGYAIAQSLA